MPAQLPKVPYNNKRLKFMVILPVAVLLGLLGLFLLMEIKAERVADPDMLSSRVQSEVFALPPLPSSRPSGKQLNGPGWTIRLIGSSSGWTTFDSRYAATRMKWARAGVYS